MLNISKSTDNTSNTGVFTVKFMWTRDISNLMLTLLLCDIILLQKADILWKSARDNFVYFIHYWIFFKDFFISHSSFYY